MGRINQSVSIVMYHYVRDLKLTRYSNIKGLDIKDFKEQIKFLIKNFNIIKMQDLIEALDNNAKLPEKSALLTFDDGYSDHFTNVFPILDEYKLQGSFFIPASVFLEDKVLDVNKIHFVLASTPIEPLYDELIERINHYKKEGFKLPNVEELIQNYALSNRFDDAKTVFVKRMLQKVLPYELRLIIADELFRKYVKVPQDIFARELYLNKEQIRCMKNNNQFIGLHGYNHFWLGNLSKERQLEDITLALKNMEEFIDKDNWVMNYPYGSYNSDTIEIIKGLGCKLAFNTEVDVCDLDRYSRYELPRLDTIDFPPRSENYKRFEGVLV